MPASGGISAESLGSPAFRAAHGVRCAYVAGAMARGIASVELVTRMGRAGLLSYFGAGGLRLEALEQAIEQIQAALPDGQPYGVNLIHNVLMPEVEERTVDLLLARGVRRAEAAAYIQVTPALVRYRVSGLHRLPDGQVVAPNRVLGKASRPEVAEQFLSPPPAEVVAALAAEGRITAEEAALAGAVPLADDLCAEADSGGHTDKQVAWCILPSFLRLRERIALLHPRAGQVRVGIAGGLGTPEAIAAAFVLGAEFVLTGSINQCTVEAGTSDAVKELLAAAGVQDTEMCPAGDMFEIGAKIQVLRRGVMFPGRANALYELYRRHDSIEALDARTLAKLERQYFGGRTVAEVWQETRDYYARVAPEQIAQAERNPKQRMGMIFRWYYVRAGRLAKAGRPEDRIDFEIHCGPAMGAFNAWVHGTPLADWRRRHVDEIGLKLMSEAARLLEARYAALSAGEGGEV